MGPGLERGEGLIEASSRREEVGGPQARRPLPRPSPPPGRAPSWPAPWAGSSSATSARSPSCSSRSFWSLGELSGEIEQTFTLDNFKDVVSEPVYRVVTGRTVLIASLVTLTDVVLAFPIAFYMAKVAKPRMRGHPGGRRSGAALVGLSRQGFRLARDPAHRGFLNWLLDPLGIEGPGYGLVAVWLVMSYIWLPYMIIPIYAGPRPDSRTRCSARPTTWAPSPATRSAASSCPSYFPAVVAGSIFTFSLTLGDFITPNLVGSGDAVHRHARRFQLHDQPAIRGGLCDGAHRDHDHLPAHRPPVWARSNTSRCASRTAQSCSAADRHRLHAGVHLRAACRSSSSTRSRMRKTFVWPPPGFTLRVVRKAIHNSGARDALLYSVKTGVLATPSRSCSGTLASLAVARYRFFGRETISFLVILPIALPGSGHRHRSQLDVHAGSWAPARPGRHIVIAHATFCIVVVYNNAVARFGRMSNLVRGGICRPRRDALADVPDGHAAEHAKRRSLRAPSWHLPSRSTRSSSPHSPSGRATKRCRSGSSTTFRGRISCRS